MEQTNTPSEKNLFKGFAPNDNGQKEITVNGTKIKGDWVEGYLFQRHIIVPAGQGIDYAKYGDKNIITSDNCLEFYIVIPETVCQYTGKKNTFEFDLIKHNFGNEIGVIRYGSYRNPFLDDRSTEHVGFYVDWVVGEEKELLRKDLGYWLAVTEIAGNIFENPNLARQQ